MSGDLGFSPYVLFRRGTLRASALAGLVPVRTWDLLDAAERGAAVRDALRDELERAMHAAVPDLPAEHRRAVLTIKRDVHNDRLPASTDAATALPEPCRLLLREWLRAKEVDERLLSLAHGVYAEELESARKTLADVARVEDFQRGVQLCGDDVYREVMAYAADPFDTRRKPSRRRRAESTITSYAYRIVYKPSPFGSFTEIGAQPWSAEPADGPRVAQTRLSVGLLAFLAHQLHRVAGAEDLMRVRLNNSLAVRGDRAVYVRRPLEGADDGFQPDRVISARHSDLVRLLQALLGDGELTQRDLCERLVAAGLAGDVARQTIDQLVKAGLCHRGIGLPDQTIGAAGVIAGRLRAIGTAQALECAEVLQSLQAVEDGFAGADAQRRAQLLAELRGQVARFVEITGCPAPAPEAMRAAMYEDVGTRAHGASWRPELLAENRAHFALFQRIVPVLDDATIEKLGLYSFFVQRYGADAEVPLTELYRAFADLEPERASEVMCGVGDAESERVRELRAEFFAMLRATGPDGSGAIRLDPARLREFAEAIPATMAPWRSAAYRVQIAGERLLVVNGVTTGHGVFFSRYCDMFDGDGGWSLSERLRSFVAETSPRQTDITAALGLNFNLHPRLAPHELVYPGSVPRAGAENVLTLAQLVVRADPGARRLSLVSTVDDQPIDLVPMNFLHPIAAPMLYRFLCAFAPTRTYRGGLWDQMDRAEGAGVSAHPRVVLGDLVLDRRSWRFELDRLPALAGLEQQGLSALAEFDRWRRDNGVPERGFFRVLAPPRDPAAGRDFFAETRQWAVEARSARLHKPHYYDTRNPFLMHVLAKQARATPGGSLVLHECLPEAAEYGAASSAGRAEEYFIEFTLGGGRDGDA